MEKILFSIAVRLWPELKTFNEQRRMVGAGDVISFLFAFPLAVIGLGWLIRVTNLAIIRQEWKSFLLFILLIILFSRLEFFLIVEIRKDRYGSAKSSLAGMLQWSAVFLFGPSTLWISVTSNLVRFAWNMWRSRSAAARWDQARNVSHDLAHSSLAYLGALFFYTRWGGSIPIDGLTVTVIPPAFGALLVHFILVLLIWSVYILNGIWTQRRLAGSDAIAPIARFILLALGLPSLAHPFSIQASGLYVDHGPWIYLFFISGLFMVALLARQLSWAAESNRQRSRQLEMLETFGRALLNSPPDSSLLPHLLEEHVPAMLPSARVAIYLASDQMLVKKPLDWQLEIEPVWLWSSTQPILSLSGKAAAFLAKDPLPWLPAGISHDPVVLTPIVDVANGTTIGCIYVELRSLAQPWDLKAIHGLMPGLKTLADQIASALQQALVYTETISYHQTLQELKFAGRIQSSLLPNDLPAMNGWELAVTLLPARETSGDFFDFIPLPDGKIGILIADVADKGIAAALYMALSRTLIRTYAIEYEEATPDVVFFAVNERLLQDARVNLFVTAFYGILDQATGELIYSNAGHNPPYLFTQKGKKVTALSPTGMPLGIEHEEVWKQGSVHMQPGDVLVLYTDGIPDAHNKDGEFYREKRLVELSKEHMHQPAQEMLIQLLEDIHAFVGEEPQFDDITLLVLKCSG